MSSPTGVRPEPRFNRRQWWRRLRTARPYLIALGVVLVVGMAGYAVFFSSWITASKVEVSGVSTLSDDEVLAAADVDLGTPLVRVNLDEIQARVAKIPAVDDVDVHRSWPHTIEITVVERTALVAVQREGSWWVMDDDGVIFRETGKRVRELPVVSLAADADRAARREAASVVASLPADLLADVRHVSARSMDSIRLTMKKGTEVTWGSAEESERKVEVLALLLDEVKATTYDVSVPEQPTTAN